MMAGPSRIGSGSGGDLRASPIIHSTRTCESTFWTTTRRISLQLILKRSIAAVAAVAMAATHLQPVQGLTPVTGVLCGWHHLDGTTNLGSQFANDEVGDFACGAHSPASGCPDGWVLTSPLCDDNGSNCGVGWTTCVSFNNVFQEQLPPGTLCGMFSQDSSGQYSTVTTTPAGIWAPTTGVGVPCIVNSIAFWSFNTPCPPGWNVAIVYDNNGSGDVQWRTCAWNGPVLQPPFVGTPIGTLCGAQQTDMLQIAPSLATPCNGQYLTRVLPDYGVICPIGALWAMRCDDNKNYCSGAATMHCSATLTYCPPPPLNALAVLPVSSNRIALGGTMVTYSCSSRTAAIAGTYYTNTCGANGQWTSQGSGQNFYNVLPGAPAANVALTCQYTRNSACSGNGVPDPNSGVCTCDSGYYSPNTYCSTLQRCGNGIVELGEQCDNGAANIAAVNGVFPNVAGCSSSCLYLYQTSSLVSSWNSVTLPITLPSVPLNGASFVSIQYSYWDSDSSWPCVSTDALCRTGNIPIPSGFSSGNITLFTLNSQNQWPFWRQNLNVNYAVQVAVSTSAPGFPGYVTPSSVTAANPNQGTTSSPTTVQLSCGCTQSNPTGAPTTVEISTSTNGDVLATAIPQYVCGESVAFAVQRGYKSNGQLNLGAMYQSTTYQPSQVCSTQQPVQMVIAHVRNSNTDSGLNPVNPNSTQTYVFWALPDLAHQAFPPSNPVLIAYTPPLYMSVAVQVNAQGASSGLVGAGVAGVSITIQLCLPTFPYTPIAPSANNNVFFTALTGPSGLVSLDYTTGTFLTAYAPAVAIMVTVSKVDPPTRGSNSSLSHSFGVSYSAQNSRLANDWTAPANAPNTFVIVGANPFTGGGGATLSLVDTSSITISGGVYLGGSVSSVSTSNLQPTSSTLFGAPNSGKTTCPSVGAQVVVTIVSTSPPQVLPAVTVDQFGQWSASVPVFSQVNVSVLMPTSLVGNFSHTFAFTPATNSLSFPLAISTTTTGLNFVDTTTQLLTVAAVGGTQCQIPLGVGYMQFSLAGCPSITFNVPFGSFPTTVAVPAGTTLTGVAASLLGSSVSGGVVSSNGLPTSERTCVDAAFGGVSGEVGGCTPTQGTSAAINTVTLPMQAAPQNYTFVYVSLPQFSLTVFNAESCSGEAGKPSNSSFYAVMLGQAVTLQFNVFEVYGQTQCNQVTHTLQIVDDTNPQSSCSSHNTPGYCSVTVAYNSNTTFARYNYIMQPTVLSIATNPAGIDFSIPFSAFVVGQQTPTAFNFVVTGQMPKSGGALAVFPYPKWDALTIIRDPPGGMSFSSVTSSVNINSAISSSFTSQYGAVTQAFAGWSIDGSFSECVGDAVGAIVDYVIVEECKGVSLSFNTGISTEIDAGKTTSSSSSSSVSFSNADTIATSQDPSLVGGAGDLFLVPTMNIVYMESDRITVTAVPSSTTCSIAHDTALLIVPAPAGAGESLTVMTIFQIEAEVAQLQQQLANITGQLTPLQLRNFTAAVQGWESLLVTNSILKQYATPWNQPTLADGGVALNAALRAAGSHLQYTAPATSPDPSTLGTWAIQPGQANPDSTGFTGDSTITFGGGATYQLSFTTTLSASHSYTSDTYLDVTTGLQWNSQILSVLLSGELLAATNFDWGSGSENDSSNQLTITFTLGDAQFNDEFTVQVLRDPIFGTPIFLTKAGKSSCPAEPNTIGLDSVSLTANPSYFPNQPPGSTVSFELQLANTGLQNQLYYLYLASGSYGATVLYDGNGAFQNVGYMWMTPGQSYPVHVDVTQGKLQDVSSYSLNFVAQAYCVWSFSNLQGTNDTSSAQQNININYDASCPAIRFGADMAVSGTFAANAQTLSSAIPAGTLAVTVYNPISSTQWSQLLNSNSITISVQYRLASSLSELDWKPMQGFTTTATNAQSPSLINWNAAAIQAFNQNLDAVTALWSVPADGMYQIRASTTCTSTSSGSGVTAATTFSPILPGIIDQTLPAQFGAPLPYDGKYYPGEPITLFFTEPLQCDPAKLQIVATVIPLLFNASGPSGAPAVLTLTTNPAGSSSSSNADIAFLCQDNQLSIAFTPIVAYDRIMNSQLLFKVYGVEDVAGNGVAAANSPIEFSLTAQAVDLSSTQVIVTGIVILGPTITQVGPGTAGYSAFVASVSSELALLAGTILTSASNSGTTITVSPSRISIKSMTTAPTPTITSPQGVVITIAIAPAASATTTNSNSMSPSPSASHKLAAATSTSSSSSASSVKKALARSPQHTAVTSTSIAAALAQGLSNTNSSSLPSSLYPYLSSVPPTNNLHVAMDANAAASSSSSSSSSASSSSSVSSASVSGSGDDSEPELPLKYVVVVSVVSVIVGAVITSALLRVCHRFHHHHNHHHVKNDDNIDKHDNIMQQRVDLRNNNSSSNSSSSNRDNNKDADGDGMMTKGNSCSCSMVAIDSMTSSRGDDADGDCGAATTAPATVVSASTSAASVAVV